MSLRLRILTLAVGATATVLVLFSVPLWLLLHRAAVEESRETAGDVARSVADYVSTGSAKDAMLSAYVDRVNARADVTPVTVVLPDGRILGAGLSDSARQVASAELRRERADGDRDGEPGEDGDEDGDEDGPLLPVSDAKVHEADGGQLVSVRATSAAGPVVVLSSASSAEVQAALRDRLLLLGAAAAALLLVVAAAAEVVSGRLVRHLATAADVADQLGEGDLTARVPDAGPPEVRRVSVALNRLAGRIDDLLAAERETAADLSHRLRTPLTAVRLDVEALPASEHRADLEEHLDQLERTLTAVIRAARRPDREGVRPRCDAAAIVRERAGYWRPLAEDQGRLLTAEVPDAAAEARCAADDLRAALDALLENCIAHTAEGVPVSVRLGVEGDLVRVDVRDRGEGLPAGAVRRGRSDRGSTGLGLDIARTCAEASGGRLELDRDNGWTVVRLLLGRP